MRHSGNMGEIGKVKREASASNPQSNKREKAHSASAGPERKADTAGTGLAGNMGTAMGHLRAQGQAGTYVHKK